MTNPLRDLPPMQRLLDHPDAERHDRGPFAAALRETLDEWRGRLRAGGVAPDDTAILAAAAARLAARARPQLRRAINATGIVIHTNLGRAPLAAEAVAAIAEAAGYCNLELDLDTGRRGPRAPAIATLLGELTGAEDGFAVNNGAAAILLALAAIAGGGADTGGEVIVSRGELVEIGGGFRIPDVIAQGGGRLVEVGTTNRTRARDYAAAIGPETRALLKVHQSNFRTIGFTEEAGIADLAALALERGVPLVVDLGSGQLRATPGSAEPTIAEALAEGADVVTCSGDKLLGGPQAGLVLGAAAWVAAARRHPLHRALRLDKLSLAALEATLRLHRDRPLAVPVPRMLGQGPDALAARAERLREAVGAGTIEASQGYAGGGALPEQAIDSVALTFAGDAPALAARLRAGSPAVVARVHRDRLLIDLLTVADEEIADLADALRRALA